MNGSIFHGLSAVEDPSRSSTVLLRLSLPWAALLLSIGCAPVGLMNDAGPGHRSQTLALSPQQESALGRQAYREILSKSNVLRAGPQVARVRQVGAHIARASQIEPLRREMNLRLEGYTLEWEFNVLQSPQVNAFCLPGGKVAVFTGLFQVAKTDDELAVVLGHEIAHALAHHANERIARQRMLQHAIDVVAGGIGVLDPRRSRELIGLLAAGAQLGSLAYDRRQESEADHIGVFLMTFAGYDPDQAVVLWQGMQQESAGRGRPPEILADHPSDAKRIAQLRVDTARVGGEKGVRCRANRALGTCSTDSRRARMSMGPGGVFGSGDFYQPRGPYGPWAGCGCSSIFMILAGILLVMGGCLRMLGQ